VVPAVPSPPGQDPFHPGGLEAVQHLHIHPVISEPRVGETLSSSLSLTGIQSQQSTDEILGMLGYVAEVRVVHAVVTGQGLSHGPVSVAPPEWRDPP